MCSFKNYEKKPPNFDHNYEYWNILQRVHPNIYTSHLRELKARTVSRVTHALQELLCCVSAAPEATKTFDLWGWTELHSDAQIGLLHKF